MSPQTIQKLNENLPEFRELRAYLAAHVAKLNSLDGVYDLPFSERAYEVTCRIQAKQRLEEILAPLLGEDIHKGVDMKEYIV